jgi:hypothetical protein
MNDDLIQRYNSGLVRLESSRILLETYPLQMQIRACNAKLIELVYLRRDETINSMIRNLRDEIFGCQIEIQALHRRANKLNAKTRALARN